MNSAQRRLNKRMFPYMVEVKVRAEEMYFQHDNRVLDGRNWCRKQFKNGSWRATEFWDHTIFYFNNQKDATYFALKWS